jgi:hypothetical protein
VPDLEIDTFAREKLDATLHELVEERDSAESVCFDKRTEIEVAK